MQSRTSERESFEQNEVIEFAPGGRTHPPARPARLDVNDSPEAASCGVPPEERVAEYG